MEYLRYINDALDYAMQETFPLEVKGRVVQVAGTCIKAFAPTVKVGEMCLLKNAWETWEMPAEVIGFSNESAMLMPMGDIFGISSSTVVIPTGKVDVAPVGPQLLGRVLDARGNPLDHAEKGPLETNDAYPIYADPPQPMARRIIRRPLCLGIRALDGLITCGEGQRMGIFAAAGVGKSTLLAALARGSEADVNVLALVGERGREVREFIEKDLGEDGLKKSVVVVSTSDRSAIERLKAAYVATAIAEYFRDSGRKVLLMLDSITRFARAQREIGLAAGEPPTRRGFPPSVFAVLPKLMERAGCSARGSITAFYTVLMEGDDINDPVADETRSILDGHIVLSRKLAAATHYPAIDILGSVSRLMNAISSEDHRNSAARIRELMAKYKEIELLVKIGEYKQGSDTLADEALAARETINAFLRQGTHERSQFETTLARMSGIAGR